MSTATLDKNFLIDRLTDEIVESVEMRPTRSHLLCLLPPKEYELLISSSELMASVYHKMDDQETPNFVIYPHPTKHF